MLGSATSSWTNPVDLSSDVKDDSLPSFEDVLRQLRQIYRREISALTQENKALKSRLGEPDVGEGSAQGRNHKGTVVRFVENTAPDGFHVSRTGGCHQEKTLIEPPELHAAPVLEPMGSSDDLEVFEAFSLKSPPEPCKQDAIPPETVATQRRGSDNPVLMGDLEQRDQKRSSVLSVLLDSGAELSDEQFKKRMSMSIRSINKPGLPLLSGYNGFDQTQGGQIGSDAERSIGAELSTGTKRRTVCTMSSLGTSGSDSPVDDLDVHDLWFPDNVFEKRRAQSVPQVATSEHDSVSHLEHYACKSTRTIGLRRADTFTVSRRDTHLDPCQTMDTTYTHIPGSVSETPVGLSTIMSNEEDVKKMNTFMLISVRSTKLVFQVWRSFAARMRRKVKFVAKELYARDSHRWDTHAKMMHHSSGGGPDIGNIESGFSELFPTEDLRNSKFREPAPRRNCIISPGSPLRVAWDVAGAVLLAFDIVMIPMSAFIEMRDTFAITMDWFTLLFWSLDMLASCLTGYIHKGVAIMDPKKIMLHYFKTWLILDILVVVPDWVFTLADATGNMQSRGGGNSSRLLRVLRVARMARVLRLVKLRRILTMIRDRIDSEHLFVFATIVRLLLCMMVVNHFLAAMWYGVGDMARSFGSINWIDEHGFAHKSLGDRYFASFHWSLTQITPASMDVQPQNVGERLYTVIIIVLGLVLFSSFISSITSSMTTLRNMEGDQSKQLWLLRRYLRQNGVHGPLHWRILRYIEYACNLNKNQVSEQKLWVLTLLSNQLRNELNYTVSFSCVRDHPFFECTTSLSRSSVVRLAENSMSVQSLAYNDRLVIPGVVGTTMYMLQHGQMSYLHFTDMNCKSHELGDDAYLLQPQDWACEPSLWTEWYTLGSFTADTECKMIYIEAAPFNAVMQDELVIWKLAATYARNFVNWLSETPYGKLTDVAKADKMTAQIASFLDTDGIDGRTNSVMSIASSVMPRVTKFGSDSRHH